MISVLLPCLEAASTLALSGGTGTPGSAVSLNLTLTSASGLPSALQWTLPYSTSVFGAVTFAAGPALTSAGKTLTCATVTGSVTCVASGLNANTIANGVVAVATVPILASANASSATLTPAGVAAALPSASSTPITATGGTITIQPAAPVTVSSVSVSPSSVTGGSNISVTVTLSGAAPTGGATIALASSNSTVVPATNLTIPANSISQTFSVATNTVTAATTVTVTASYNSSSATSVSFTVNPASTQPTGAAAFVTADVTTQGWWKNVYGADGYNIINNAASYPSYVTATAAGAANFTWAASTNDPRALQKAAAGDRIAACWYSAAPFTIDLKFTDSNTHQVALYLLDWDNSGRKETLTISDANGKTLDTRTAASFSGGQYLVWNLSGHVVVHITNNASNGNAVVSGLLFGGAGSSAPPPPPTATAQFVTTDGTTAGAWKTEYGLDGYNVIGDTASYPAYATVTSSGNSTYVWASATTDRRALQRASGSGSVAACWYGGSYTIDMAFSDGQTHQVALYLLDWDGAGRAETVQVQDANGAVLDTRSASGFSNGQYLVWKLSGHVVLTITRTAGANAVISGIFFGAGAISSSASFVKTDTATEGSWHGVYGADGFNVIGNTASYPAYAAVTPSGNGTYVWAASTSESRALQKVADGSDRIAACWYGSSFTIDLMLNDGQTHQVALYLLDWDAGGRAEIVRVLDASGNVLDTRSVAGFANGQYLVWNLSGHVVLSITPSAGTNAVASGVFFR